MKFAEKIIWSCLLTVMIVFSIGGTIMLDQNHQHLLSTTIQQNISTHEIAVYTIDSKLRQDSLNEYTQYGYHQESLQKRILYYIEQLNSSLDSQKVDYLLYDSQQTKLYSRFLEPDLLPRIDLENYTFFKWHDQYVMVITSQITGGNENYYLTSLFYLTSCYEERQRQVEAFLMIGLFIIVLSFFALKMIAHYLTNSILQLNQASQRIAQGCYSERTHIQSQDEIGELSRNFDEMAAMNEKRIADLQMNLQQREEFMGSFSHEIKTPMTSIIGFADMLRTYDCDEDTRRKAAQYIFSEAKRLESLSYTLMDLLSLSEHHIELQPIDVSRVFNQLQSVYDNQRQIVFDYQEAKVIANAELLFILIRNLVDNAIKASQAHQQIIVQGLIQENHYHLAVCDYGCGMSKEDIQKVTQPFYMIDKSRSRQQGGAGLGLSIVERICQAHHATLQIASVLGQGTTMSVELEVSVDD